jgi:hypothetical protein
MPNSIFNVSNLVDKRALISDEITNSIQKLSTLNYILSGIEAVENTVVGSFVQTVPSQTQETVARIILQVCEEQERLTRLRERFNKDELCIGVVGLARQGKSTILQSLSGLDSRLIPTDSGLHCTASTSFITNTDSDRVKITVSFHNRDDFFVNTILPFFKELSLSPVPANLAEFEVSVLPLQKNLATPNDEAQYKKLLEYHRHISQYSYLLTGISRQVGIDEMAEYVVHYTEEHGVVYKYLAVEQIEISCSFPYSNIGKLTLIDMPGAGDVSVINEAKRIKKLISKVDFLLFVRKPDPLGDAWNPVDLELYNACSKAMTELGVPDLDIKDNSFLVLNHVNFSPTVNNLDNCRAMGANASSHGMKFSEIAILDCSDSNAVSEKILRNISSFVNKISDLDDQIMYHSRKNISSIFNSTQQMVNVTEGTGQEDDPLDLYVFKEMFNNLWSTQTNAFENLLKQKYVLCLVPNEVIYDHFKRTKLNSKALLARLTEADVKLARNAVGSYNKAYEDFLNEYKTHITNEFIKLDAILLQVMNGIKNEVYEILKTDGKLSYMSKNGESFDKILLEEVGNITELRNSLHSFINFQLSYLGFLHFKIREYLDILTPDFLEIRLSREDTAEDILKYIKHSVEACLYKIEKEFYIWSQDINKISFSLLEEFLNQIFRSKHAKDNWEIFYQVNVHRIWPDRYSSNKDKQNQYNRLKKHLEGNNEIITENIATIYEGDN